MAYEGNKLKINNLERPTVEEAQALIEQQIMEVGNKELLESVRSAYAKTKKNQIESEFKDPEIKEHVRKKRDYSSFSSSSNNPKREYEKISSHFTVLRSKEFEELHHSTLKRGNDLYLHLKTGNSIHISKRSIDLIENDLPVTAKPNLKQEVKTMIALAYENNMKNITLEGDKESLTLALEEIKRINSLVKDEKDKIFVIPKGPEQEALFKEIINPAVEEKAKNNLSIKEVKSDEGIEQSPENVNKKRLGM